MDFCGLEYKFKINLICLYCMNFVVCDMLMIFNSFTSKMYYYVLMYYIHIY